MAGPSPSRAITAHNPYPYGPPLRGGPSPSKAITRSNPNPYGPGPSPVTITDIPHLGALEEEKIEGAQIRISHIDKKNPRAAPIWKYTFFDLNICSEEQAIEFVDEYDWYTVMSSEERLGEENKLQVILAQNEPGIADVQCLNKNGSRFAEFSLETDDPISPGGIIVEVDDPFENVSTEIAVAKCLHLYKVWTERNPKTDCANEFYRGVLNLDIRHGEAKIN